MMRIVINGEARDVADGVTVEALVRGLSSESRGIAVAVDGEIVPRSEWASAAVAPGQSVEILNAVQGG